MFLCIILLYIIKVIKVSKHHLNTAVKKYLYLRKQNISVTHAVSQNAAVTHREQEKFSPIANFILYYLLFFSLFKNFYSLYQWRKTQDPKNKTPVNKHQCQYLTIVTNSWLENFLLVFFVSTISKMLVKPKLKQKNTPHTNNETNRNKSKMGKKGGKNAVIQTTNKHTWVKIPQIPKGHRNLIPFLKDSKEKQ